MVLGLSLFTESSSRSCHKLGILSVFYWWFSFVKPPKILTLLPEKDKLYYLSFWKCTTCNLYCRQESGNDNVQPRKHWHWSFLTENLIHIRVDCCFNSIEKVSGILL